MKLFKKECISQITLLSIVILFIGLFIFKDNLFFGEQFILYNDQHFQYNIFYEEYFECLKETFKTGEFSFYSWNLFLGTDFFASKIFTVIGDFFALPIMALVYLISGYMNFDLFFVLETILCLMISGLLFYLLLEKRGIKDKSLKFSLSLVYALSGFVVLFTGTYMFHRFYALLPLLFISTEYFIQDKKIWPMSISVFILFLQNFELMYTSSLFLVLYYIVSYKEKDRTIEFSKIIKSAFPLIGGYIVGILMSGFVLCPLFLFLQTNGRVGSLEFDKLFWSFKETFVFLSSFISSN